MTAQGQEGNFVSGQYIALLIIARQPGYTSTLLFHSCIGAVNNPLNADFMKHYISAIIVLLLICIQQHSFGQSKIKDGSVTGSASLPDAGAIMELESNNKGFLLPRVALRQYQR